MSNNDSDDAWLKEVESVASHFASAAEELSKEAQATVSEIRAHGDAIDAMLRSSPYASKARIGGTEAVIVQDLTESDVKISMESRGYIKEGSGVIIDEPEDSFASRTRERQKRYLDHLRKLQISESFSPPGVVYYRSTSGKLEDSTAGENLIENTVKSTVESFKAQIRELRDELKDIIDKQNQARH